MIKVFEAFSGVGSQKMALRNLGVEHEVVATSDIDEYAIISYDAIHTSHKEIEEVSEEEMQRYLEERNIPLNDKGKRKILKGKKLKRFYEAAVRSNNLGDISKIETEDIPDHDLFTYSFPCFTGDMLILTDKGYKRMDEIEVGDMVLTHKGRYRRVNKVFRQGIKSTVYLNVGMSKPIHTTSNHKFYAKEYRYDEDKQRYVYGEASWVEVSNLTENHLVGYMVDKLNEHQDYEGDLKEIKSYQDTKERFYETLQEDDLGELERGIYWVKHYGYVNGEDEYVYDIEVEEDHSFTVSNIVVKNCQDISVAGKGRGLDEDSGTRSGLLWECQKVIQVKKPRYLLLENVKNLVSKKHIHNFEKWLEWLEDQGYKNYWKVVNAKTQGVPQNRERVFVVSILGEGDYNFPEDMVLTLTLDDLLEDEVDERYYLSEEIQERFLYKPKKTDISILGTSDPSKKIGQRDIVYGTDGIMGSLMASDYKQPKQILRIKNGTKLGYLEAEEGDGVDLSFPSSNNRRGRVQKKMIQTLDTGQTKGVVVKETKGIMKALEETEEKFGGLPNKFNAYNKSEIEEVSPTVTANSDKAYSSGQVLLKNDLRIRKLTPLECWRLMGFTDEDFKKAQEEMSDTQLYKQAGNSIVVNVLEGIFSQLFNE